MDDLYASLISAFPHANRFSLCDVNRHASLILTWPEPALIAWRWGGHCPPTSSPGLQSEVLPGARGFLCISCTCWCAGVTAVVLQLSCTFLRPRSLQPGAGATIRSQLCRLEWICCTTVVP